MTLSQYFEEVLSQVTSASSCITDKLVLAGRTVHLNTQSEDLRARLLPSLSHLSAPMDTDNPALTIWYAEDKNLPARLKAPPWQGFNAQGYNADLLQDDVQIFFQPWQKQIFLYSRSERIGIYWAHNAEEVPWWESTFSFRVIFHFWTRDLPSQLIHAGAMGRNGSAVLITGQSGSGKSTSCLQLLRQGYQYLGDDYVWIEHTGDTPSVHTLFQTAKVEPENLHKRFSDWLPHVTNAEYMQQKAIFHISEMFPGSVIKEAKLKAILLPRVAGQEETEFERTNPTRALFAMAPTTLHHLPHNREASYQKLMNITSALPSYHWKLGYDLGKFYQSFSDFSANEMSWN